jgi:transcriptional regulator with XRE-family HTH domain
MAGSADAVDLVLKTMGMNQKELALKLGVSPGQISKWKKGEYMSLDMKDKIKALAQIGDFDPSFVVWAGSLEAAEKWDKLFEHLAERADEGGETGYRTYPLTEEAEEFSGILAGSTIDTLEQMGVEPPKQFPDELNVVLKMIHADYDEELSENAWDAINDDPYSSVVYEIYKALTDVWGFYHAYVEELINDDDLDLIGTSAGDNFEPCLMNLAASKIRVDVSFAPKFHQFRGKTRELYKEWCSEIKRAAIKGSVPLRAEIMDMVYQGHDPLGHQAEAEALGFNDSHLHPDIYMNELLTGMRTIHQVLPAIIKKLGMEQEFTLDSSELSIDVPSSDDNGED